MSSATLDHAVDLDPSLVEGSTYASRRRRHLFDAGAILSILIAANLLIPADLVVPQLTSLGRPALMLGMLFAVGWFVSKLHPRLAMRGPQPIRWAATAYLTAMLMAYAAGYLRGLPTLEANAADRGLIGTLAFLGVLLVAADGLSERSRLDSVIRVFVWCAGGMAIIGLLQAFLNYDVTVFIRIPGLSLHHEAPLGFMERDGFYRVAATAQHYIEFSTVMAMGVPFAIHFTLFARTRIARQLAGIAATLMAAAIPMTLSRTGVVALLIALTVMFPVWNWRLRTNLLVLATVMLTVVVIAKPGLIAAIYDLFAKADKDPSISGRTDDYSVIWQYIAERPWFGRGPGTFIPTIYFFVDNEWLQHLVTAGIVGVAALAGLHITAITLGILSYRRATSRQDKHLAACLVAVQFIAMAVAATFDSMGFTTYSTTLALFTGATGAMWRFTHPARIVRSSAPRLTPD